MVSWFDPGQLLRTAAEVIVSSIIGRHADRRLIEQLSTKSVYFEFNHIGPSKPVDPVKTDEILHQASQVLPANNREEEYKKDVWIDYVSDVGDGWNATYAIAQLLAQPVLTPKINRQDSEIAARGPKEKKNAPKSRKEYPPKLYRGDLLIFGGDSVYPKANRNEYRERWAFPYKEAIVGCSSNVETLPYAFAIPGNHDWYDSLATFSEMFSGSVVKTFPASSDHPSQQSANGQPSPGWLTPQFRSYFAIKLPYGNWWLFGIDTQLHHDLDEAQLFYFKQVAEKMGKKDRVILCCPEPYWIYKSAFQKKENEYEKSRLKILTEEIIREDRIYVYLAGDLHHYYRIKDSKDFTDFDGVLRITAGGGGAFMHPTHGREMHAYSKDSRYQVFSYPDEKTSRNLALWNLGFPVINYSFNIVTGFLYFLTSWLMLAGIGSYRRGILIAEAEEAWVSVSQMTAIFWSASKIFWGGALLNNPFLVMLCLIVIFGFFMFSDKNMKTGYRCLTGLLHGSVHLASAGLITWLGCVIFTELKDFFRSGVLFYTVPLITAILWVLLVGAVWGAFVMGLYLLISLNGFGYHTGEGSSLKIEGYKNFVRMRLEPNGQLTLYAIGLDQVPCWSDDPIETEWERNNLVNEKHPSRYVPKNEHKFSPRLIDGPLIIPPPN